MRNKDVGRAIRAGAAEYASLADPTSRTSVRARVLKLIDGLSLDASSITVRAVGADELRRDASLRGAVVIQLDLASRVATEQSELMSTAERGLLLVAEHAELPGFPVGAALAVPAAEPVDARSDLFAGTPARWEQCQRVYLYALATNPGGLGAGRALLESLRRECAGKLLVAYAPLNGLRARIIQIVEDAETWSQATAELADLPQRSLARQLAELLIRDRAPEELEEPSKGFLAGEARRFASSEIYRVGRFHQYMGAALQGVDDLADPADSDAMWARAQFAYDAAS